MIVKVVQLAAACGAYKFDAHVVAVVEGKEHTFRFCSGAWFWRETGQLVTNEAIAGELHAALRKTVWDYEEHTRRWFGPPSVPEVIVVEEKKP